MKSRLALLLAASLLVTAQAACSSDSDNNQEQPDVLADSISDSVANDLTPADGTAGETDSQPWPPFEPVVFSVLTDIHIDGDMTASTPQKVAALVTKAATATPAPEFITITGDLTETVYEPVDLGQGSRIETLKTILQSAALPIEGCLGNHDYYKSDELLYEFTEDRDARDELFRQQIGFEPWYYTIHGGVRFVYLNAMQGDRWNQSLGLNGSMGQQQLQWLDALLSDGKPALLFLHHPPSSVLESGDMTLEQVVQDHAANVMAIFVGHVHVFARDQLAGVPLYVTEAGYKGNAFHHVRVDASTWSVEILNEADIDYGETEVYQCDPANEPAPPDSTALEGRILEIRIPDAHILPLGLGSYLRDMVASIPLALRLEGLSGNSLTAMLTTGTFQGDATEDMPAYIKQVSGSPCTPVQFDMNGSCLQSQPVNLRVDLARLLGLPLPASWKLRADFNQLTLAGVLSPEGDILNGSLTTSLDLGVALDDVKDIIIQQYCAEKLTMCKPGIKGMPTCPEEPTLEFFETIPETCDVEIVGVGLRMVFAILASVPDYTVSMDANFSTFAATTSDSAAPGSVSATLFDTCPTL